MSHENTCCKCGNIINGCICFSGEGDMCNKCYQKYILQEIKKRKKKIQPIKTEIILD